MNRRPTALIAEDEPLLAQELQAELMHLWPNLHIVAVVADGVSAVKHTLLLKPDILFLDIQMPGLSGLEAATELLDAWGTEPFPALVYVTAYDQFAVQAFEAQAIDYLLKPVQTSRLKKTVSRLQQQLAIHEHTTMEVALNQLHALLQTKPVTTQPLHMIQASTLQGNVIRMILMNDVLCFDAADKYLRVIADQNGQLTEYLIRMSLKELLTRIDPTLFWQIHRGTVVRCTAIESVSRDEMGKLSVHLIADGGIFPVSRIYAQRFKAM